MPHDQAHLGCGVRRWLDFHQRSNLLHTIGQARRLARRPASRTPSLTCESSRPARQSALTRFFTPIRSTHFQLLYGSTCATAKTGSSNPAGSLSSRRPISNRCFLCSFHLHRVAGSATRPEPVLLMATMDRPSLTKRTVNVWTARELRAPCGRSGQWRVESTHATHAFPRAGYADHGKTK